MKQRWANMLSQCSCQAPYLSFEWYHSALETIDKDKIPLLLFFKSSGEDIGLAPLVYKTLKHLGFTYHRVGFVHNPHTPYQGFLYTNEFKEIVTCLMNYLRKRFGAFFYLDLDEIRLTPEEETIIRNLHADGLFLFTEEEKPGSRYLILNESFKNAFSSLEPKTQKEFRRKIRRLSSLGSLSLIRIKGGDQIKHHLDRFFRFFARSWKGEESHPEFYYRLCKDFEDLGKLYFYALTLDGQSIAYLITLLGRDIIYGIKTTFNPSYYAFSPGIVLFYKSIEDMFNIPGIREFDIGRGDEQFKREWTSLSHRHVRLFIYPNSCFWHVLSRVRYDFLPLLRKQPVFNRIYSLLRARLVDANQNLREAGRDLTKKIQRRVRWDDYKDLAKSAQYVARFAQPEDLEVLAVTMASRSLGEVQKRMSEMRCILILGGERILAYFWIPPKASGAVENICDSSEIKIDDWGLHEDIVSEQLGEQCTATLLKFLVDRGIAKGDVILVSGKSSRPECTVRMQD